MNAFQFWYKSDIYAPTEYIYIIAVSLKQARYFYTSKGFTRMYDYSINPVNIIQACLFKKRHEVGDILGQYAVI